jgi:hypothetical protein
MQYRIDSPRAATVADADVVAELLDRFNREYDTPSPGITVLTARLERLLSGGEVVALLAGEPAVGPRAADNATECLARRACRSQPCGVPDGASHSLECADL